MAPLPRWKHIEDAQRVDIVKALLAEGKSPAQIAEAFLGVSRNAVIGFCYRRGLALVGGRADKGRIDDAKTKAASRPPARPKASAPRKAAPRPTPAGIREREPTGGVLYSEAVDENLCRWPLWNSFAGGDVSRCCGGTIVSGRYCAEHAALSKGRGTESERSAYRVAARLG